MSVIIHLEALDAGSAKLQAHHAAFDDDNQIHSLASLSFLSMTMCDDLQFWSRIFYVDPSVVNFLRVLGINGTYELTLCAQLAEEELKTALNTHLGPPTFDLLRDALQFAFTWNYNAITSLDERERELARNTAIAHLRSGSSALAHAKHPSPCAPLSDNAMDCDDEVQSLSGWLAEHSIPAEVQDILLEMGIRDKSALSGCDCDLLEFVLSQLRPVTKKKFIAALLTINGAFAASLQRGADNQHLTTQPEGADAIVDINLSLSYTQLEREIQREQHALKVVNKILCSDLYQFTQRAQAVLERSKVAHQHRAKELVKQLQKRSLDCDKDRHTAAFHAVSDLDAAPLSKDEEGSMAKSKAKKLSFLNKVHAFCYHEHHHVQAVVCDVMLEDWQALERFKEQRKLHAARMREDGKHLSSVRQCMNDLIVHRRVTQACSLR